MKPCNECGINKPLDDFYPSKLGKLGRTPKCKPCVAELYAARKAVHGDQMREKRSRYYQENKEAINARGARYRAENRERNRLYQREYYEANQAEIRQDRASKPHVWWRGGYVKRAKRYGFDPVVENFTRAELVDRWGDQCFHCGGPFEELDHWPVPVALGGVHSIDNCRPSCFSCNREQTGPVRNERRKAIRSANRQGATK